MEYAAEIPIYLQVIRDLEKKIIQGNLNPGDRLPSSRELAVLYKINQNTAARIYRELEDMGYCFTRRGIGTFLSEDEAVFGSLKQERAEQLLQSFMKEMKELGFEKKNILSMVSGYPDGYPSKQENAFEEKESNDVGMYRSQQALRDKNGSF